MHWHKRVYLDRAAGESANPSSPHEEGRAARQVLEDARERIARILEVQKDDIVFTGGATEANALAILGIAHARAIEAGKPPHVLYLPSAHASIVENAKMLTAYGAAVEALPIREYRVDTDALKKMLRPETALVSMEAVCGETGVVWNTREVANVLRGRGVLLHIDASQAALTEKMTRAHFGADVLTLDASKVSTARGIGALVARRTIPIAPLYAGGGQERGLRPGSEAPELAARFAAGLAEAAEAREAFRASAQASREALLAALESAITGVFINAGREQAPHILNISLPGRDTDYLVALLDEAGFAVSTKSACETDSEEGSRAVLALTGDPERARATLRISWGSGVSPRDLARFSRALTDAAAFIDRHAAG
jgi:cysteine desulfurase